jgi:prevent-host-death family protein
MRTVTEYAGQPSYPRSAQSISNARAVSALEIFAPPLDYLVGMTRKSKSRAAKAAGSVAREASRSPRPVMSGRWPLQDAKARLSELIRRAKADGPQSVTVHGREEAVILSAEEFRKLSGDITGQALVDAMQASPHRDIEIVAPIRSA